MVRELPSSRVLHFYELKTILIINTSIQSGPLKTKQLLCSLRETNYTKNNVPTRQLHFRKGIVREIIHPKFIPTLVTVTDTRKLLNKNIWPVIHHLMM